MFFIKIEFDIRFSSQKRRFYLYLKKNELRLYINYKKLNAIIIKNRYLLFLIIKTLSRLFEIKIFIKLSLKNVYYKIRIKKTINKRLRFEFIIIISNI